MYTCKIHVPIRCTRRPSNKWQDENHDTRIVECDWFYQRISCRHVGGIEIHAPRMCNKLNDDTFYLVCHFYRPREPSFPHQSPVPSSPSEITLLACLLKVLASMTPDEFLESFRGATGFSQMIPVQDSAYVQYISDKLRG